MQAWRNPPNSPPDSNETAFEKVGTVHKDGFEELHKTRIFVVSLSMRMELVRLANIVDKFLSYEVHRRAPWAG